MLDTAEILRNSFAATSCWPRRIISAQLDIYSAFYKAAAANTQTLLEPITMGIFPGSFDPVTKGHARVLVDAGLSGLFNRIVVMVGNNPDKEKDYYFRAPLKTP